MRLAQLGQAGNPITDFVGALVGSTNTHIRLRSNVTPVITLDIGKLVAGENALKVTPFAGFGQAPEPTNGNFFTKLLKPEILIRGFGAEKVIAPYGRPTSNYFWLVIAGFFGAGLLGLWSAYAVCRRIPPKKRKKALP